MTTVNLQQALDFCIKSGATVEESAKKFGVDRNELSRMLSEMMNPNGGGEVGDKAEFKKDYGNEKVAHATLNVNGQKFEVVAVGIGGEKGASMRVYDQFGMEVSANDLKDAFKIDSFRINENGEMNVVVYPDAPKMTLAQKTDGEFGFIDTLKNFWKFGAKDASEGVVVVASKQPAIDKVVAQAAEDYGVDKEAFAAIAEAVKGNADKISDEAKENVNQLAAKIENAKTEEEKQAAVSEFVKFVGALLPDALGEIGGKYDLPPAVLNACAAVVLVAMVAGAAKTGAAVLSSRVGQLAAAVFTGVGLTSCSPEPDEVNQTVNLTINSNSSLEEALDAILQNQVVQTSILKAILEKEIQNGMSFDEIKELIGTHTELLTTIIDALATNNDLLTEIKNSIETGDADILKALVGIQNSVDVLTDLVADGGNYSEQLQEILNAIKNGNASVDELKSLITNLLFEVQNNGDIQADILAKLEEIQNSNLNEGEKLIQMLELLKNIDNTTQNISEQLNTVINQINQSFGNDKEVQDALNALIKLVQEGNAKQDVTNEMLNKLLEMMQNGVSKEDIKAIIEAISKNGDKIDDVNFFLNKIQNQDQEFQKQVLAALADLGTSSVDALNKILEAIGGNGQKLDAITQLLAKIDNNVEKYGETGKELGNKILEAINQLGADIAAQLTQILEVINTDKDTGKNIEALLQKVLTNMDGNTKAIIDAISNIKIEGGGSGNVDLSSLEKMLNELLQLTAKNNGLLESIDGKMDVINLTIERAKEEILEKLGQNNSNTTAILNALNEFKNISTANDKEILEKMDTIINILNNIKDSAYDDSALMAKLDDILAAIKDHKVTVDVTGKVTCECNCGGNHEGIIGDLEDILG